MEQCYIFKLLEEKSEAQLDIVERTLPLAKIEAKKILQDKKADLTLIRAYAPLYMRVKEKDKKKDAEKK